MPLVRARCTSCSQPLGDPPHVPLAVVCPGCRAQATVSLAADGQPADFDAAFNATRFLHWIASARAALARGAMGVAVGSCARCSAALLVSSRESSTLPCPHCGTPVMGPAAQVLVDQWTEPWTRVEGGGLSLEYRLALVDGATAATAGCASCGAPTPANDPSTTCRRCGAVAWVERDGHRVQLGVRVDGTRNERPFTALVSLPQGDQVLRRDLAVGTSAASGSSLLGVTGIGCAVLVASALVLSLVIAILVHYK